MVRASTISTRLAAKTAMTRTRVEEVCIPLQNYRRRGRPSSSRRLSVPAVVCGSLTRTSGHGAPVTGAR